MNSSNISILTIHLTCYASANDCSQFRSFIIRGRSQMIYDEVFVSCLVRAHKTCLLPFYDYA